MLDDVVLVRGDMSECPTRLKRNRSFIKYTPSVHKNIEQLVYDTGFNVELVK